MLRTSTSSTTAGAERGPRPTYKPHLPEVFSPPRAAIQNSLTGGGARAVLGARTGVAGAGPADGLYLYVKELADVNINQTGVWGPTCACERAVGGGSFLQRAAARGEMRVGRVVVVLVARSSGTVLRCMRRGERAAGGRRNWLGD